MSGPATFGGAPLDRRAISRFVHMELREVGDFEHGEFVVEGHAHLSDHLRGPGGAVRAGALLTLIDNTGGTCSGLASLPDAWVVSTNIALHTARHHPTGPLRLSGRVLRAGRRSSLAEVRVTDAGDDDALVALGTLTSAVLVPEGGPPEWERPAVFRSGPEPGDPPLPPLLEWLGVCREPWERGAAATIELTDELRNPWGILHGGFTATLADVAGELAVAQVEDGPVATADLVLHYLAPGRVGPVRAAATRLGRRADGHVVRVEIDDLGAGRTIAVATSTVRPLRP